MVEIFLLLVCIGVDQPSILRALGTSAFETQAMQWKKRWPGKIIFGVIG